MKGGILLFCALALASSAACATSIDEVVWRVPLYTPLPSADSLDDQIATHDSSGAELLVFGTTWSLPYAGTYGHAASRVVALDRRDGSRRWQTELNAACALPAHELERGVFRLSALPNGDVAVALSARLEFLYGPDQVSACYARLDAADGRILWARTEAAPSQEKSFKVYSLKAFRNGDLAVNGIHAARGRTLRLSAQDGRTLWSAESTLVRSSVFLPFDSMEVDPATDDVMLMSPAQDGAYPPLELRRLDGRTGQTIWHKSYCTALHWIDGRLSAIEGGGVAFSFRCMDEQSSPDKFTFGIASDAGASAHDLEFGIKDGSPSIQHGPSGDVFIAGQLRLDGVETAIARFSAANGRMIWSVPGKIGGPDGTPRISTLRVAIDASSLFAWEVFQPSMPPGQTSTRVTRFDPESGQLIAQRDIPVAAFESLSGSATNPRILPNGSLSLAALPKLAATGWLWVSTIGRDLETIWQRREAVAAEQFSVSGPIRNFGGNSPLIVPAASGPSGVLIAALATEDGGPFEKTIGQPTVFRLARRDGRKLWEWRPKAELPSTQGQIHSFTSDGETDAYVAGAFRLGADGPFLARIDITDGHTVWQVPLRVLSLLQRGDDALYAADETSLYRLSVADGQVIWRAEIPQAAAWGNVPGLGVGRDGNPVVALSLQWSGLPRKVRVAKFDAADGSVRWQVDQPTLDFDERTATELAVLANGDVVVSRPAMRLRSENGEPIWRRADLSTYGMTASSNGRLAFRLARTDESTMRICLDASTGATLWSEALSAANARYDRLPLAFDRAGDLLLVDTTNDDLRVRRVFVDGRAGQEVARIPAFNLYGDYREGSSPRPTDLAVGPDGSAYLLTDLPEEKWEAAVATIVRIGEATAPWQREHEARPLPPLPLRPGPTAAGRSR